MHASVIRRAILGALALLGLSLVLAPPVDAARFGVAGFGAYHQYAMRDVNKQIGHLGDELDSLSFPDHFDLENIETGLGGGLGLRYEHNRSLLLSLDYNRLGASSSGERQVGGQTGSASVSVPGNVFTLSGTYFLPMEGDVRFGLLGGLGYYSCSGDVEWAIPTQGRSESYSFSGSGVGFHAGVSADGHLKGPVRIEGSAAYRYAKTGQLERDNGEKLFKFDGGEMQAEWTGSYIQFGLVYYFEKKAAQ